MAVRKRHSGRVARDGLRSPGRPKADDVTTSGGFGSRSRRAVERGCCWRSCMHKVAALARLRGRWGVQRRRSLVSCDATRQHVAAVWNIVPSRPSAMPNGLLDGRSQRSWRSTQRCGDMCKIDWLAWSSRPTELRSPGQRYPGQVVNMALGRIDVGLRHEPATIAHRLRLDFPDDETIRISHEAIYQSLYVQSRGALRRELTACLRTGGRCACRGHAAVASLRHAHRDRHQPQLL